MTDRLDRFVAAQRDTYATALAELAAGDKRSHWMWFVFPQIAGLGQSPTARHYAIADRAEAAAYLAHPLLGARLLETSEAMLRTERSATQVLGTIDAMKLRSSMTLFEAVATGDVQSVFARVLDHHYRGERDAATLRLLNGRD